MTDGGQGGEAWYTQAQAWTGKRQEGSAAPRGRGRSPIQMCSSSTRFHLAKGVNDANAAAEELYAALSRAGIEVLLDDRKDRPGSKFKDADLIGIPLRVNVGGRSLKEGVFEVYDRKSGESENLPVAEAADSIITRVQKALAG